jgi:hypothetical protein
LEHRGEELAAKLAQLLRLRRIERAKDLIGAEILRKERSS